MPVDEPGEDEPAGGVDKSGPGSDGSSGPTSAIFPPRITIRPFGRGLLPVPSISVPFLMTRISSKGELIVVSKSVCSL